VSVKVSAKTKKEMEHLKDKVEWPDEIRAFIEGRLEQAKREETIQRVDKLLSRVTPAKRGTAAKLVREDRDSGH
jgi:hypothetical protein